MPTPVLSTLPHDYDRPLPLPNSWSSEEIECLHEAVQILPARERRIVECRFFGSEGKLMTYKDIAGKEGLSAERVRQLLGRALEMLSASITKG